MANNDLRPSLPLVSQTSDSESSEHHSLRSFATLPSSSSEDSPIKSLGTTRVGYISSTPTTGNGKNKRKISEVEGYILVPRNPSSNNNTNTSNTNNDQQSDMVTTPMLKRPRGRPPGSKNKPKRPMIFLRQPNEPSLTPILFVITPGTDVVDGLINFARSRNVGISILSGFGPVSDVVIHNPVSNAPDLPIQGSLYMMALTGSFFDGGHLVPPLPLPSLPLARNPPSSPTWPTCSSFSILLSGTNGQVFGGVVGGRILAAGTVIMMAVMIKNPEIERPLLIDDNGGGDDGDDEGKDDDDNIPFGGVVIDTNAKVIDASGGGGGGGGGGGSGSSDVDAGNVIMGNNDNNKGNIGATNLNDLPNICAAYGFVGSAPLPLHIGASVCNVNLMQC